MNKYLPQFGFSIHLSISSDFPWQFKPFPSGEGLLHFLDFTLNPCPHVFEHWLHSPQLLQLPSTEKMDAQMVIFYLPQQYLSMIIAKLLLSILVYSPHCEQDFLQKSLTFLFFWRFFKPFVEHVLKGLTFFHGWLQYPLRARTGQFFIALQRFFIT